MDRWSRRRLLKTGLAVGFCGLGGCGITNEPAASGSEPSARTAPGERTGTRTTETTRKNESSETRAPSETPETVYETAAFTVETVASGLGVPWALAFGPDGALYFTERPGRIGAVSPAGRVRTLERMPATEVGREGGVLGLDLHPGFPRPPFLYVYQTYGSGEGNEDLRNRILRYERTASGLRRRGTIVDGIPGYVRHNGGRLAFGPDGKLYATTGDTTEERLAQKRTSLAGKTLRMNPDGSVPSGNPFSGSLVWSLGHRNPQGLAFHHGSGTLFATEHGPEGHDELNRIDPGRNYGWPIVAGTSDRERFRGPILASGDTSWAPAGAIAYGGRAFPAWRGNLFFAALGYSPGEGRRCIHNVALGPGGGSGPPEVRDRTLLLSGEFGRLRAMTEGPDGAIYVTTSNRDGRGDPAPVDDRILRLRPNGQSSDA